MLYVFNGKLYILETSKLCHQLHDKSEENLFKLDGCFKIVKHRCSLNYVSESVSFESKNYREHFITKCGNQLKIQPENEDCGDF